MRTGATALFFSLLALPGPQPFPAAAAAPLVQIQDPDCAAADPYRRPIPLLGPDGESAAILQSQSLIETPAGPPQGGPIDNSGSVPQDVVAADLNRDGVPDLAIAFAFDDMVRWYYGTGDGAFTLGGEAGVGVHAERLNDLPRALVAHDFDDDGFADLAVLCSGNPNPPFYTSPSLGILYGTPSGQFEPFHPIELSAATTSPPRFSTVLAAGPLNGDGQWDLLVGHFDSRQISVVEYAGRRRWKRPTVHPVVTTGSGPAAFALADLDFDGAMDLVVANRKDLQVWRGDGEGGFRQPTTFASGAALTAVAAADLDSDGAWDLVALDGAGHSMQVFMGLAATGVAQRVVSIPLYAGQGSVDLVCYDANLDGHDDVALVFLTSNGGDLFLGQPRGARLPLLLRQHFQTARSPRAIAAADFDVDGRDDLAIVHEGDQAVPSNEDLVVLPNTLILDPLGHVAVESSFTPGWQLPPYLNRPRGLGWDAGRQALWTIDRMERRLVRLSVDGQVQTSLSLVSLSSGRLIDPADVAIGHEGHVWVSDRLAGQVYRFHAIDTPSPPAASFPTTGSGLEHPCGVAFDQDGKRLLVSDEREALIGAFSSGGAPTGVYRIRNRRPLLDLACNEATGRLWATRADDPQELVVLELNERTSEALPRAAFRSGDLAELLAAASLRSVALDVSANGLWLLTDSGTLVQANIHATGDGPTSRPVQQMRELALLREIHAVALEPEGTILLADGGLLATLVRLDRQGVVRESWALNHAQGPRVAVAGLCRQNDWTYVLDGRSESVLVFETGGALHRTLGAQALAGRHPRGLHVTPAGPRFFVGTPGRLIELASDGSRVSEHPIRASAPPGSLSAGPGAGDMLLFSPLRYMISIFSQAGALRDAFIQTRHFPPQFIPRAAAGARSTDDLILVGSGDPTLLMTRLVAQPSAVDRSWQAYR